MNDESALLARIRKGEPDDFAEIIERHREQVFRILHRYERDAELVADLAQETFVKAWQGLGKFDGRAPFSHWLSRIALRVALDHLRKRRRLKREISLADLGEDALEWLRSDEHEAGPRARDAREIIDLAMRDLSAEERLVITLLEIEARSVREISGLLGCSGVAVRVRAFRARGKLKKALERLMMKP